MDLDKLDLIANDQRSSQDSSSSTATVSSSPLPTKRLAPEPDALGNLEYKLRILPPTRHRYDRLLTQMKWRMLQGGGQCTYEIGVLDDGRCIGICPTEMRASLRVLASLAAELGATVNVRRAFTLLPGSILEGMSMESAQEELVEKTIAVEDVVEAKSSCGCSVSVWPSMPKLDLSAVSDYDSVYTIAIADENGNLHHGAWLGEADDIDSSSDGCQKEGGLLVDEDGETGFTYSLSFDERSTMLGTPQRRGVTPRRRCRYKARTAAQQRQKEGPAKQGIESRVDAVHTEANRPMLKHTVSNTLIESGELQPSNETEPQEQDASNDRQRSCKKLIVEAVVTKMAGQSEKDYIDYTSL